MTIVLFTLMPTSVDAALFSETARMARAQSLVLWMKQLQSNHYDSRD